MNFSGSVTEASFLQLNSDLVGLPRAATTNHHSLGGLKKQIYSLAVFEMNLKSWNINKRVSYFFFFQGFFSCSVISDYGL